MKIVYKKQQKYLLSFPTSDDITVGHIEHNEDFA